MKLSVHCFAKNVKISPQSMNFKFREFEVQILSFSNIRDTTTEKLTLKIVKVLNQDEIAEFKQNPGKGDNPETFFASRSRKYEEALKETAHLVEGLLAILFGIAPPKFETSIPIVNLIGENEEEINLLDSDVIMRGFGYLTMPTRHPLYQLNEKFTEYVGAATGHLPALSFLSLAKRSFQSNDHEIAFFLYFRVIDGYFAYAATKVENALVEKEAELSKYLLHEESLVQATSTLLLELGLPSKSQESFVGLIKDIVLIRHKLTHFSSRKTSSHHSHRMFGELAIINSYLDHACNLKLQEEIGIKFD